MKTTDDEIMKIIRNIVPNIIAQSITEVQPMDINIIKHIIENSKTEEELINDGYEPVEKNGHSLMWVKKNEQ